MSSLFQQFLQQYPLTPFLQQMDHLYLHPNIPIKKIQGAMYYLPVQTRPDEILLLVDNTLFGSAKAGFCLTEQQLFIREDFEEVAVYQLNSIHQVNSVSGMINTDLQINSNSAITLTQLDRKAIQMLADLLWQFILFQRQNPNTQKQPPQSQSIAAFVEAIYFLIYLAEKYSGQCSTASQVQLQDLLQQAQLTPYIPLTALLTAPRPAFIHVVQKLRQGAAQLSGLQKRLIMKAAMQLMWVNQWVPVDVQKQIEDLSYVLNISLPDLEQAIEETMREDEQSQEEDSHDLKQHEALQQACQLLGLNIQQLDLNNLQQAYRRKMAEFHPDQYQQLPQAVRQLIEQQGYANAMFDRDEGEDGMQVVEEFYPEPSTEVSLVDPNQNITELQQIQQGLQHSVRVVN